MRFTGMKSSNQALFVNMTSGAGIQLPGVNSAGDMKLKPERKAKEKSLTKPVKNFEKRLE